MRRTHRTGVTRLVARTLCVAATVLVVAAVAAAAGGCSAGASASASPGVSASSAASPPAGASPSPGTDLDDRLRAVVAGMTLREKVGQVFMIGIPGTSVNAGVRRLMGDIQPGGVILMTHNVTGPRQVRGLTGGLQKLSRSRSGQPLFIATDQEGGAVRRIPWIGGKLSQEQMRTPDEARAMGVRRGRGLERLGINLDLAPVLDLGVPGDFLTAYDRCFAGGWRRVGSLGKSIILGQKAAGIMSTAKHFPGYGGVIDNPETIRIAVKKSLPESRQFGTAAEAEPEFVMAAVDIIYRSLDATRPFSMSPKGLRLLRASVPGEYLVISDALNTPTMLAAYGLKKVVVASFAAGVDVLLIGPGHHVPQAFRHLLGAVRSGRIDEAELDERVLDILRVKAAYFGE